MPTPGKHKTVQVRILAYAQELGWAVVPREEAERGRGFDVKTNACVPSQRNSVTPYMA